MTKSNNGYHHGDLRSAILEEAAAMIAEGGAGSVTMRELGRRLGVSRAAAYRHFKDRTALLVAVAASGFDRLGASLAAVETKGSRPSLERLRRMGAEYVRFALENPAHYRLMYGKEALARDDQPELEGSANALFEHFVEVFQAHQRGGIIRKQDARMQAYVAWSAVHGLASLIIEGQIRTTADVDGLIRLTTRTLLEGIRVR